MASIKSRKEEIAARIESAKQGENIGHDSYLARLCAVFTMDQRMNTPKYIGCGFTVTNYIDRIEVNFLGIIDSIKKEKENEWNDFYELIGAYMHELFE